MRRVRERDVLCLLLLTLLILYLLMWFWFGSLQPASSVFLNYEVNKMLGQERQGKVKESRSNLDVVTVAGLGQRRLCPLGSFRLSKMETCMPWLGCKEITNEVTIKLNIGSGTVKKVYKAVWRNHTVAYSRLKNTTYFEDFSEGIEMLKTLQHPAVLQFGPQATTNYKGIVGGVQQG
ncbi:hypothetical protein Bbelb_407340 [Branchiostoma belcheri]|nr:hypothetical protein Bbelb_407340 [Branchiostoma belcheri]